MPLDVRPIAQSLDLGASLHGRLRLLEASELDAVTALGQSDQIRQDLRWPKRVSHAVIGQEKYVHLARKCFLTWLRPSRMGPPAAESFPTWLMSPLAHFRARNCPGPSRLTPRKRMVSFVSSRHVQWLIAKCA